MFHTKGSANGIAFACKLTLISPAGDFPKTAEEIKRIIQFSANMTIICISNIHLSQNRSNTTGYQDHIYRLLYCYTVAAPMVEASIAEDSFDGGDLIQFRGSAGGAPGSAPAILAEGAARPALQLRSHFPETWLFSLQPHRTRLLR